MKAIFMIGLTSIALWIALPAQAQTANDLLSICVQAAKFMDDKTADVDSFRVGRCLGYIEGFTGGSQATNALIAGSPEMLVKKRPFCFPQGRQRVHDKAVADLNSMMAGRFKGFNGEYAQYGCYAHAMAQMGIAPVFKDHARWYVVSNPFFDIMPSDPLIDETIDAIKRKHGVEVSIDRGDRLFDKIKAARGG